MMDTPRLRTESVTRSLAALVVAVLLLVLVPFAGTALARPGEIVVSAGDGLVPSIRFAGEDRFDTAELIATDPTDFAADYSGTAVILARADQFPDALAGSTLAGLTDAPILLTPSDTDADDGALNEDVQEALDAYTALEDVYLLGGIAAIGDDVADAVEDEYGITPVRIGGENRFETAALIADETDGAVPSTESVTAIVARGDDFADALVAGSLAAAAELPLLLTGTEAPLDPFAEDRLETLGVDRVIIAGGTAAVSTEVEDEIEAIVGDGNVDRVAGPERTATAVEFAQLAAVEFAETGEAEFGFDTDHVNLAFGFNFPDALALGPHAGLDFNGPAPILLSAGDELGDATADYFVSIATPDFIALHVAGGTAAVPLSVEEEARELLTVEGEPSTLVLSPETATNFVNEVHEVTATVVDNGLEPVAGLDVDFGFETDGTTGVAAETVTVTTSETGTATVEFTSSTPGDVIVTATVSGSDDEDLTGTALKTFVAADRTAYVATGGTTPALVAFDLASGTADPTSSAAITGMNAGTSVVGMDFRPRTGQLYTLGSDGQIYTVVLDSSGGPTTAVATALPGGPLVGFPGTIAGVGFDFNPAADAIRVVDDTNRSFRVNPITGAGGAGTDADRRDADVAYAAGDTQDGDDPGISAVAYDNSVFRAETSTATELYDIDTVSDTLSEQFPANAGTLTTVGPLGVDFSDVNGFDIASSQEGSDIGYAAVTTAGDDEVYQVDLEAGTATLAYALDPAVTEVTAFAIAPQEFDATFTVALAGINEEPEPNATGATGTAVVQIDTESGLICSSITVDPGTATGTFGGSPGAHIHEAGPNEAGPIVHELTAPSDDARSNGQGCTFTDPGEAAEFAAAPNDYYVNVHTTDFPAGLVRGQLDNVNS